MPLLLPSITFAQLPAPAPPVATAGEVEVERVIVTGSNIPTAEETGPNPVDTYRPGDIEKLGIRNATDLTTSNGCSQRAARLCSAPTGRSLSRFERPAASPLQQVTQFPSAASRQQFPVLP